MRQREKRENWRGWAERRARDDDATIRKTTRPIYRSAEFLTHRETLVTVDRILPLGCRSFVNARCNGEPLAVHPVRAWDEGAIYTTRAPTHSAVKTLSTGENRLAQNRLPDSPLCARPFNDARQPHDRTTPSSPLACTSFHPSSTLSRAARPRNPSPPSLSLPPRARDSVWGPVFDATFTIFVASLVNWLGSG